MSSRTFALILAGFLFTLSAGAVLLMRTIQPEESPSAEAFVRAAPPETLESPTGSWQTAGMFGAQYSVQYGQWSLRDDVVLMISDGAPVYAPMSGTVPETEALESGGSRVIIRCGDGTEIELHPVYSLRVFEGSRVSQGDVIGSGKNSVLLKASQNGMPVDPLTLAE